MLVFTRLLSVLLLAATISPRLVADTLGDVVDFQAARGWTVAPTDRPSPFPTLRYEPGGGQNAALLLTLLPADRFDISDSTTMRKLHLVMCRPYIAQSKATPPQTEFKLSNGFGVYSVFEDPDLVGKVPKAGDYKVAIPVAVSLGGKALVHATILCDDPAGASQAEAWRFIRSLSLAAASPTPASPGESTSATTAAPGTSTNRFMYAGPEGIILSGWLDRASKFPGMRSFWAKEKASLEKGLGQALGNESMSLVAGWNVVSYTMTAGADTQQNLRACRVFGDTWVDVHLSQTGAHASVETLKALLPKLGLVTKN